MSTDETFLARWSRRKAAAEEERGVPPPEEDAAPPEAAAESPLLPDIDTLDRESDYAAFMRPGVDDVMRKQALRRLWQTDLELSAPDGLVEYGEDYAARGASGRIVRTAWRLGRGMTRALAEDEVATASGTAADPDPEQEPGAAADGSETT